jgi:hypothetical protein
MTYLNTLSVLPVGSTNPFLGSSCPFLGNLALKSKFWLSAEYEQRSYELGFHEEVDDGDERREERRGWEGKRRRKWAKKRDSLE